MPADFALLKRLRSWLGVRNLSIFLTALVAILSLASSAWLASADSYASSPPDWAFFLAVTALILGVITWLCLILCFIDAIDLVPNESVGLQLLQKCLPDFLGNYNRIRSRVMSGELLQGTDHYDDALSSIESSLRSYIKMFWQRSATRFLITILILALCTIVLFAGLYSADWSLEYSRPDNAKPPVTGYDGKYSEISTQCTAIGRFCEGIYFSTMTFATVGYGDISPSSTGKWSRLFSTLEVLTSFFLFGVVATSIWGALSARDGLDPGEIQRFIRLDFDTAARFARDFSTTSQLAQQLPLKTPLVVESSATDLIHKLYEISKGAFQSCPEWFAQTHDDYCELMRTEIQRVLKASGSILSGYGVDWVNLHYKSRHIRDEWSSNTEWINVSVPLDTRLGSLTSLPQVYNGQEPPYFRGLEAAQPSQAITKVIFTSDQSEQCQSDWLHIKPSLTRFLQTKTQLLSYPATGTTIEEIISKEDVLREVSDAEITRIETQMTLLTGKELTGAEALAMLRDACRWTLFTLRDTTPYLTLPRVVIHAPALAENNIIGGIAFCGTGQLCGRNDFVLAWFTSLLLDRLRLIEEQQFLATVRQREIVNSARDDLAEGMGHSIITPLATLLKDLSELVRFLQLLQSKTEPSALLNGIASTIVDLRANEQELVKLKDAVERLMAGFRSDKVEQILAGERTEESVRKLLELLVFVYGGRFQKAGKILSLQKDIPINWRFYVDKTCIWEIFSNLLTNALRFAVSKTEISVQNFEEKALYRFQVTDDGPGVDSEIRARLFTPLFREAHKESPDRANIQHGVGLYFARIVLQQHHGEIHLDQDYREGARFVVDIPSGTPDQKQKGDST